MYFLELNLFVATREFVSPNFVAVVCLAKLFCLNASVCVAEFCCCSKFVLLIFLTREFVCRICRGIRWPRSAKQNSFILKTIYFHAKQLSFVKKLNNLL